MACRILLKSRCQQKFKFMEKAPVSVIITAYNFERYIEAAVKSVQSQTLPVSEIIVVDNNSTDKTVEIAGKLGVKVVEERRRQGTSAARNAGIRESRYEWLAMLDGDDIWHPQKIASQMKVIDKYPQAGLIVSDFQRVAAKTGGSLGMNLFDDVPRNFGGCVLDGTTAYFSKVTAQIFGSYFLLPSTAVYHRRILDEVGFYDENIIMEDVEYFARVLKDNSLFWVREGLVDYRFHGRNYSTNRDGFDGFVKMVEKMMRFPDNYIPDSSTGVRTFLKERIAAGMRNQFV